MTSDQRPGKKQDFLARRGGWMLVTWGVVLVALACIFRGAATIAPIFAFTGVASVVLGILAARFEGDFELSATRLKGKLLKVVAESEDLTLEEKGDEMVRIVEGDTGVERHLWTAWLDRAPASAAPSIRYALFEEKAKDWFRGRGWQIRSPDYRAPGGGDFTARKNGAERVVEVKYRSRLGAADIRQILGQAAAAATKDQPQDFKFVLVVPPGSLTADATAYLAADHPVPFELLEIPPDPQ